MDKRFFLVKQLFAQQIAHPLKFSLVVALLFVFAQVAAQDIHFSQIDASDLVTVNPANTGNYDGDWKFGGLYRSQWPEIEKAFSSTTVFYDQQIGDKLSAGLVLINDQAGLIRLNTNKVYLSGAYHTSIGKEKSNDNQLRIGLQLGGVYKSIDPSALTFPRQFDRNTGVFNAGLDNFETNLNDADFFIDINAGVNYQFNLNDQIRPNIGFAVFHVNNPKDSFLDEKQNLPQRYVADVGVMWQLQEQVWCYPYAMTTFHAKANETLLGIDAIFAFYENVTTITGVFAGVATRLNATSFSASNDNLENGAGYQDAIIAKVGVNLGNIRLGFAYDHNVSELQSASNNLGAFEVSLIYMARSTKLKEIQVPCDRF